MGTTEVSESNQPTKLGQENVSITPELRVSTGIARLDELLGEGLLPGTLTVVLGATGIGKTQLGIHFAHAGKQFDQQTGLILDLCARGDQQRHADYAERMRGWKLQPQSESTATLSQSATETNSSSLEPTANSSLEAVFRSDGSRHDANYHRLFASRATRVTRRDLDTYAWQDWQAEINDKMRDTLQFLYAGFVRGARRVVVDGFEPVDRPGESVQYNLFDYLLHQAIQQEHDWLARELFRERFSSLRQLVEQRAYDHRQNTTLALCTSKEQMLEDLIARPLDEGDVIANANTLILLGKIRDGNKMSRGLFVAKHRGSACSEEIVPYTINDAGLNLHS
jgi:KaiC